MGKYFLENKHITDQSIKHFEDLVGPSVSGKRLVQGVCGPADFLRDISLCVGHFVRFYRVKRRERRCALVQTR